MIQKKIILFIPSIEKGGVEKNLFIIANYLSYKYKELSIISATKKEKNKFNKKIEFLSPKTKIWNNFGRGIKTFVSIFFLIKKILQDRKTLVLSFQSNVYAIIICKIFSVNIIARSNSFPDDWTNNFIKNLAFKKILPLAKKNIVNSIETKKKFRLAYNIDAKCIYNPLNKNEIIKLSKKKTKNIYLNKNFLKIIHVGRFSEEKDHITFLNALNLLKTKIKFEAVIMGKGHLKKKILQYIKNNNLRNNIKILDYKINPYPYIKQADFLILTSLHEGLPNILLEAIVLNKFVISSNCQTGPEEILDNGKGGALFKVGDSIDLAQKIIYYSKNKKIRNKKIKFALSRLNRFHHKLNLNEYFKVLEN